MIIVLSPAKTLDFDSPAPSGTFTQPELLERSEQLVARLRKLSRPRLAALMNISDTLADENARRYRSWSLPFTTDNARPALFAFRGDVYQELQADRFGKRDVEWARKHLRILSGLHGVLRPLDLIQPYRLEMGTAIKIGRTAGLYAFWGDEPTDLVNQAMRAVRTKVLVNLASQEYFRVLDPDRIDGEVITPVFKERRNGQLKLISYSAKRARGIMARFLIRSRAKTAADIEKFADAGYQLDRAGTRDGQPLFTRSAPA